MAWPFPGFMVLRHIAQVLCSKNDKLMSHYVTLLLRTELQLEIIHAGKEGKKGNEAISSANKSKNNKLYLIII